MVQNCLQHKDQRNLNLVLSARQVLHIRANLCSGKRETYKISLIFQREREKKKKKKKKKKKEEEEEEEEENTR